MQADRTKMLEMFSREGECVRFEAPVEAKGNIEVWLQRLVEGMQVRQGGRGEREGLRMRGGGAQHGICPCRLLRVLPTDCCHPPAASIELSVRTRPAAACRPP